MIARLRESDREGGFTLVELLISASMGVIVMGVVAMLMIGTLRSQPKITKESQNVTSARWMLERLTHELRNGITVKEGTASRVSFEGYVRHSTCGGTAVLAATSPAIKCRITWECTTTACSRKETNPGTTTGTARAVFTGLSSDQIFAYAPNVANATYVKVTLQLPDPTSSGSPLVISSGASLRNATLGY